MFDSAWSAASYLAAELPRLESVSRDFRRALFTTSVPPAVIDALAANITVVRSPTCFRIEDGSFLGWEGIRDRIGCGQGNVNHVWNYAQTVAFLFPELERSMREIEFGSEMRSDGAMPFRARRVLGDTEWDMVPAADGQLGAIVRLCREWKLSGDHEFLRRLWPSARRALEFAMSYWDRDGDGVPEAQQNNTYDIEFYGPNPMIAGLFAAALRAGAEMARAVGDDAADRLARAADESATRADALLWNGEYYAQRLDDVDAFRYQHGDGCLADQLLGQFLAHVSGLGYVLPPTHVKRAAQAVHEYNFRPRLDLVESLQRTYALNEEPGLVLCSWPRGGKPRFPFAYCDEVWTGVEYEIAALLIYEGFVDEGVRIVDAVRGRHDGFRRNPWSESEAGHHYVRAMSSWALLTALSGYRCDLAAGTMSFEPALGGDFRTFWSNGRAWGIYTERGDDGGHSWNLEVLYGDLDGIRVNGTRSSGAAAPEA